MKYYVQIIDHRNEKTYRKAFPTGKEADDQIFKSLGKLYLRLCGEGEGYKVSIGDAIDGNGVHIRKDGIDVYTIEKYHD